MTRRDQDFFSSESQYRDKTETFCQTPVLGLGLGFKFVLPLSQQQEQEEYKLQSQYMFQHGGCVSVYS